MDLKTKCIQVFDRQNNSIHYKPIDHPSNPNYKFSILLNLDQFNLKTAPTPTGVKYAPDVNKSIKYILHNAEEAKNKSDITCIL